MGGTSKKLQNSYKKLRNKKEGLALFLDFLASLSLDSGSGLLVGHIKSGIALVTADSLIGIFHFFISFSFFGGKLPALPMLWLRRSPLPFPLSGIIISQARSFVKHFFQFFSVILL